MAGLSWQVEISQKRAERQRLRDERDALVQHRLQIESAQEASPALNAAQKDDGAQIENDAREVRRALRDVIGQKREISQRLASLQAVTPGEGPVPQSGLRRMSHSIAEAEELLKKDAEHLSAVNIQLEILEKKIPIEAAELDKIRKEKADVESLLQQARVRGFPKEHLSAFEQLEYDRIQRSIQKIDRELQRMSLFLPTTQATARERMDHRRLMDRLKTSNNELHRQLRSLLSKGVMQTELKLREFEAEIERRRKILQVDYADQELLIADQKATTARLEILQKEAGPIAKMMEVQRLRAERERQLLAEQEHTHHLQRIHEEKIGVEMKEQALRTKLRELDSALLAAQSKAKSAAPVRVTGVPSDLLAKEHSIEQRLLVLDREILQLQRAHQAGERG